MPEAQIFKILLDYGGLGILLVLLLWFARTLLVREQNRADAAVNEVSRLNALMQDKTIPALINATQAISASQSLLQALQLRQQIEAEARKVKPDDKPS